MQSKEYVYYVVVADDAPEEAIREAHRYATLKADKSTEMATIYVVRRSELEELENARG